MELITIQQPVNNNNRSLAIVHSARAQVTPNEMVSSDKAFIQANTVSTTYEEIKDSHIIPVFIKDNEPAISQLDFINVAQEVANEIFSGETILAPSIRVSHPVKGRVPEAKLKPAIELLEHEKTLYYERMAFVIEVPSIYDEIDGSTLSLTIGGVKAYNLDNLYNKKGADEHFKVFIGFKNSVCTNLCVWTDGLYANLKVSSVGQLKASIRTLIENFNANLYLHQLQKLTEVTLNESQFARLIGKCKMYQHLPKEMKDGLYTLALTDNQISLVTRDFYNDDNFRCDSNRSISLWRLYNLFTGANKTSYIDNFLERGVNTYHFVERLRYALKDVAHNWFLE